MLEGAMDSPRCEDTCCNWKLVICDVHAVYACEVSWKIQSTAGIQHFGLHSTDQMSRVSGPLELADLMSELWEPSCRLLHTLDAAENCQFSIGRLLNDVLQAVCAVAVS
jgi:hypothetical protein